MGMGMEISERTSAIDLAEIGLEVIKQLCQGPYWQLKLVKCEQDAASVDNTDS